MSRAQPSAVEQTFKEAEELYAAGHFAEAAEKYESLLAAGWVTPELFYNLGNAYFKAGQYGRAALNYRKAWYLRPRDPDVLANLRFTFQTASAPIPEFSGAARFLTYLNRSEWVTIGTLSWWLACLLFILATTFRRFRAAFLRGAAVCGIVLLVCMAGYGTWRHFSTRPEYVVAHGQQDVRFAPLDNAVLHFVLPEGAIVRELEKAGDWVKISISKKDGWIRCNTLFRVWSTEVDASL